MKSNVRIRQHLARWESWSVLGISLLALGVRLQNLTYHSVWFDEAMSIYWARSTPARIVEVGLNLVEDRLPPLYYLLLHGWRLAAGDGEFAYRFPSVVLGVLLVPIVFCLGRELFGRRVGVLAALLSALSPFLVWYSQEARMYALAVLLATLGSWLFFRAVDSTIRHRGVSHSLPLWLGYGLCALAGLYTHLYTGFLLPAQGLYLLFTWRRTRRALPGYVLTMAGVTLAFVPLALAVLRASGEAGSGNPWPGLWARLWQLQIALVVWQSPLAPATVVIIATGTLALALIGLGLPRRAGGQSRDGSRLPHPRLLAGLLWLLPIVIATLLMTRNKLAFFGERYFIVVVPWMLLLMARGAVQLGDWIKGRHRPVRSLAPVLYLLPIVLTVVPLPGQWSPPARKEAWRETVAYLAKNAHPQDAVLIHPDWTRYPLQYYFRGPGQTYAIFSSVDDTTNLDPPLEAISQNHPVVWLVESHTELADPDHLVDNWFANRYPLVTELYPPGLVAVRAYAPGYISDSLPDFAEPTSFSFRDGIQLIGYTVSDDQVNPTDDLFHPPSGWVHVILFWRLATDEGVENGAPYLHMVDSAGQIWGASLERANDAFDFYPPTRWRSGDVVRTDYDVNLNPMTPSGKYLLVAGVRDEATGQPVPLSNGTTEAVLATIQVNR